jgi:hypothetical protein
MEFLMPWTGLTAETAYKVVYKESMIRDRKQTQLEVEEPGSIRSQSIIYKKDNFYRHGPVV